MNIGETKNQVTDDIKADNYKILNVEKLHLNVSVAEVKINNEIFDLGYSYQTIVVFRTPSGIIIRTNEYFSPSSQKHKSQVLAGMPSGELIDLPTQLYDFILNEVLEGNDLQLQKIKNFCNEHYDVVKVGVREFYGGSDIEVLEYLINHKFLKRYGFKNQIKEVIKEHLYYQDSAILNNRIIISRDDNKNYICSEFEGRVYQNLSFLNKLELEGIISVL